MADKYCVWATCWKLPFRIYHSLQRQDTMDDALPFFRNGLMLPRFFARLWPNGRWVILCSVFTSNVFVRVCVFIAFANIIYMQNSHINVHPSTESLMSRMVHSQLHGLARAHTKPGPNQIKFKMHHKIQYVNRKRDKLINADFSVVPLGCTLPFELAVSLGRSRIQINSNAMLLFSFMPDAARGWRLAMFVFPMFPCSA